jgi:hypothetical protein
MNQKNSAARLLLGAAGLLSLAAAVCLYFALTVDYDLSIRHFARNSPFAYGFAAAIGAALLCGIAAGILKRRSADRTAGIHTGTFGIFAAAATAFMLLASFILSIRALSAGLPVLEIVRLVMMALSAAFFFLIAAREKKTGGPAALLALCPLLFSLLSVLTVYFDKSYGMNAPVKICWLLAYISMTLFFTGEVRVVLGRPLPFWHTVFGVFCLAMTVSVGLSHLAVALFDTVGHGFSLIESALFICIALYTAARLFCTGTPEEIPAAEEAPAAEETEEARAEE